MGSPLVGCVRLFVHSCSDHRGPAWGTPHSCGRTPAQGCNSTSPPPGAPWQASPETTIVSIVTGQARQDSDSAINLTGVDVNQALLRSLAEAAVGRDLQLPAELILWIKSCSLRSLRGSPLFTGPPPSIPRWRHRRRLWREARTPDSAAPRRTWDGPGIGSRRQRRLQHTSSAARYTLIAASTFPCTSQPGGGAFRSTESM